MARPFLILMALAATACSPPPAPVASAAPSAALFVLAQPNVTIAADPAPPFTYWAPEGATIRNHPNVPGLWQAFVGGKNVATYFGDACGASRLQAYVGKPLQSFPPSAPGAEVRTACETCPVHDDLRPSRINVIHDNAETIVKIACY
jgi:hypothetical protein